MGFYRERILPRLIDLVMKNQAVAHYRGQLVPQAGGRVLEIGVGSGLNLPFYRPQLQALYGLDPSARLLAMAGRRSGTAPFPVELLQGSAEEIPLASGSVDTVVSTWTLCSIPDLPRALAEVRRVLRPGGSFLFVEHGLAPEARVRRWQHRLNPLWQQIGGGCNLDRKMDELVAAAGFRIQALETGYAPGPKTLAFMYRGLATPEAFTPP